MIKTIPTTYNGTTFRSRLEARWAVFFDQIGLKWIFEMEGYELSNGQKYLPDFYFPELLCFGEVKPEGNIPEHEMSKIKELGKINMIILLQGMPNHGGYKLFSPDPKDYDVYVGFHIDKMLDNATGKIEYYWRFWWTFKDSNDMDWAFNNEVEIATKYQFKY